MPVIRAWEGSPSVINPMIAGAAKKKTDKLDAERLSFHDLTEVWEASYDAYCSGFQLQKLQHHEKRCDFRYFR